jgi:radical SAM protein (TIGR01212 family)
VKKLKKVGICVIVHQILGLPGETREMMVETSRYIGTSGADGVKLHLLHVLEGTDLAEEWRRGRVSVMELEEYISVLEDCVRNLPRHVVLHRLTGDGAKRDLLSPLWSGDKKRVLNTIHRAFLQHDVEQGSAL